MARLTAKLELFFVYLGYYVENLISDSNSSFIVNVLIMVGSNGTLLFHYIVRSHPPTILNERV